MRAPIIFLVRARSLALVLGLLGSGVGCKKTTPETPPPKQAALLPLEVSKEASWLFTYADASGAFVTTDDPQTVPEGSRRLVRVIDPSADVAERRDLVQVYAIDLDEFLRAGKVQAQALSREAFETGALAQLPPGASSAWPPPAGPASSSEPKGAPESQASAEAAPSAPGDPVVTLYGTSWCGACRAARQYLSSRNIPFAEKDIEKDPAAARELAAKAARLGVPADRVPILDVRGRLLIGFDQARLEALLGQPS
jgi:glutaredoxin